jgi:hypothetical protein
MIDWLLMPMAGRRAAIIKPRPRLTATKIPKMPHACGREGYRELENEFMQDIDLGH